MNRIIPVLHYPGAVRQRQLQWLCGFLSWLLFSSSLLLSNDCLADNWIYTVRPGDNLWKISERYLTSNSYAGELLKINRIKSPADLQPGTKLEIPIGWLKRQPSSCRLVDAQGEVTIIRAAGEQPETRDGEIRLFVGDTITTGVNGTATLEFADKSRLLIQPDSELVMDTLSSFGDSGMVDTRLRLPAGRVETQVTPKKGPASRYEITTPAAVAAVRGTDFRVDADQQQNLSRSEVLEGKVAVQGDNGSRDIPAGFGTITQPGKTPIEPVQLLPAPDSSQTGTYFDTLPLQFEWKAIQDAHSYRIQVYLASNTATPFLDRRIETHRFTLTDLQDNIYNLRIRGIDKLGLEGFNRDHQFTVNARPFAPQLITPQQDSLLRNRRPVLDWRGEDSGYGYWLQLSTDQTFGQVVIDSRDIHTNSYTPGTDLPETQLYWRVAALDADGMPGPYSATGHFSIRTLPKLPLLASIDYDRDNLKIRWQQQDGQSGYDFQLATDSYFNNIAIDTRVSGSDTLIVERPESNIYYYRSRAFNSEGDKSPFTKPELIHIAPVNYNNSAP